MKKNYKILSLLLLLAFASCSFTSKTTFTNPDKDKLLVQVITFVLEQGHFDPIDLDDEFRMYIFWINWAILHIFVSPDNNSMIEDFEPNKYSLSH